MPKIVTSFGDSARFLWDELVASALGDNQQEHMFGSRVESHTSIVARRWSSGSCFG
jgi:hypothetical protein